MSGAHVQPPASRLGEQQAARGWLHVLILRTKLLLIVYDSSPGVDRHQRPSPLR